MSSRRNCAESWEMEYFENGSLAKQDIVRLLMRASLTSSSLAAAFRLACQIPEIFDWLISEGLLDVSMNDGSSAYAIIRFEEALERLSGFRGNPQSSPLSRSAIDALAIAASLAGVGKLNLRSNMNLDRHMVQLVAEAIMYANDFMDGAADPVAHDAPGGGPNARIREAIENEFLGF